MGGAQGGRVEAEALAGVGQEVLDHNVRAGRQPLSNAHAVRVLEVDRNGAFVAVHLQEVGALARDERRPPLTAAVAAAGPLDLDHVGAQVGQHHRAVRPGQDLGQVKHPDVGEGEVGHRRWVGQPVAAAGSFASSASAHSRCLSALTLTLAAATVPSRSITKPERIRPSNVLP